MMGFEIPQSRVYIQIDAQNRVARCEGGYTAPGEPAGWIYIDQGVGDRYNLCQNHYFEGGLYTVDGISRYEYRDGAVTARTKEEIAAERLARPKPGPTAEERLSATEAAVLALMEG